MSSAGLLEVRDLAVLRGGREVVHGIDLDIPAGAITALLGANGAGKSSTVLAIGGLEKSSRGTITVDGADIRGLRPERVRAAGVAIVPEGRRLLRALSVADNLVVATYTQKPAEAKESIARVLDLFPELRSRLKLAAGSLSGGEQQMVAIAQAVASNPKYLFVDELSLGLAPVVVKRLAPVLTDIAASGVGVLLIEQFASVALSVAQRAYLLDHGRIRFSGTTAELRESPEILTSAYLAGDS